MFAAAMPARTLLAAVVMSTNDLGCALFHDFPVSTDSSVAAALDLKKKVKPNTVGTGTPTLRPTTSTTTPRSRKVKRKRPLLLAALLGRSVVGATSSVL